MNLKHMSMSQPLAKQRGMGATTMLIILSAAIFISLFAVKVGPHYFENMTVSSVAENAAANADLLRKPRSQIYASLNQAYRTNSLWDLKAEDTIKLKKVADRGYELTVQYEKRANLFANIDVVTRFDKVVEDPS